MTVVVVRTTQPATGGAGGGGDVTPDAVNWGNITTSPSGSGLGHNSNQTISGIDATILISAEWSGTAEGCWFKNGAQAAGFTGGQADVNASNGDVLYFSMDVSGAVGSGKFESGTVTVKNYSDTPGSPTTLDTFTYSLIYIP